MEFKWTREQEEFLIKNYPDMDSMILAELLGLKYSQVRIKARHLHLKKSKESLVRQARNAGSTKKSYMSENSLKNLLRKRTNATEDEKSKYDDIIRRRGRSLSERFVHERIRVCAGLQQETKLKITFASKSKRAYIWRIKKNGYREISKNVFMRPLSGILKRTESFGERHNIKFVDYEEE